MDTTTATPAQIDTELARLHGVAASINASRASVANTAHRINGERATYKGKNRVYTTPLDETLTELALKLADEAIVRHEIATATECIERIAQLDKDLAANAAEIAILDAEYAARPWSRFIAVADGHLHSGTRCAGGTIRVTTTLGWHPELSGKTEAEAVALLGPMLCTHCFPTAPVEFTVGKPKADRCEGAGLPPVHGSVKRVRMSVSGRCTGCDVVKPLTQYGYVRAHKPAKA